MTDMSHLRRRLTEQLRKSALTLLVVSLRLFVRVPKRDDSYHLTHVQVAETGIFVCLSVNIGSTKTGNNMTAVRDMGRNC